MEDIAELVGVHARRGARHGELLRHAAHRAGRPPRHRRLHEHRLHARGRLRGPRARRGPRSGSRVGQTTDDGEFTLEEAECLAGCDNAPCVQVNHRFFGPLDADGLRPPRSTTCARAASPTPCPPHGVLSRVERTVGLPGDAAEAASAAAGPKRARRERCRRDHQGTADRHLPGRPRGLVHPRALPRDRRLRGPAQGARR